MKWNSEMTNGYRKLSQCGITRPEEKLMSPDERTGKGKGEPLDQRSKGGGGGRARCRGKAAAGLVPDSLWHSSMGHWDHGRAR